MIGGGITGIDGLVGCMRNITIDGIYLPPSDWKEEMISHPDDIAIESCYVTDRCNPNPCEHGGVCKQVCPLVQCFRQEGANPLINENKHAKEVKQTHNHGLLKFFLAVSWSLV